MQQDRTRLGGLYIVWLSDTHFYGGRAKQFKGRWRRHIKHLERGTHPNVHMQNVFNKHGRFDTEILQVLATIPEQITAERQWLKDNFGTPGCVNLSRRPTNNTHLSPEARKKISEANKGRKQHPNAVRRSAESRRGLKQSEEHRRNNSLSHKGIKPTEEARRRMSKNSVRKGKPIHDALRAGIVAANKRRAGETRSSKVRAKIAARVSSLVWVCNAEGATTRVLPENLPNLQAEGWQQGRKYRAAT
jgi:group I intron endonuclease